MMAHCGVGTLAKKMGVQREAEGHSPHAPRPWSAVVDLLSTRHLSTSSLGASLPQGRLQCWQPCGRPGDALTPLLEGMLSALLPFQTKPELAACVF